MKEIGSQVDSVDAVRRTVFVALLGSYNVGQRERSSLIINNKLSLKASSRGGGSCYQPTYSLKFRSFGAWEPGSY